MGGNPPLCCIDLFLSIVMDFSYYGRLDSIFIFLFIIFVFFGFVGSYKTYLARAKVEFKVKGRKQSHAAT